MKEGKRPSWFRGTFEGGKAGQEKPEKEIPADDDSFIFAPTPDAPALPPHGDRASMAFPPDDDLFEFPQAESSSDWQAIQKDEPKDADEMAEMKKESALVHLYLEVSRKKPADFKKNVRQEIKNNLAPALRAWTVESLHTFLAGPDVWRNSSFTQAVFEEIQQRMMYGGGRLLPRD